MHFIMVIGTFSLCLPYPGRMYEFFFIISFRYHLNQFKEKRRNLSLRLWEME